MSDNMIKYVICPMCKAKACGMFCPECGSRLEGAEPAPDDYVRPERPPFPDAKPAQINHIPGMNMPGAAPGISPGAVPVSAFQRVVPLNDIAEPDDTGLSMLIDYCRSTVATIGGDGYDESVLYLNEETGAYELHSYSKYVYMEKEAHYAVSVTKEEAEAALQLCEDLNFEQYINNPCISGLCGGRYVCKYKKGDTMVRVSTDICPVDPICRVGVLLQSFVHYEDKHE